MCGIFGVLGAVRPQGDIAELTKACAAKIHHRGPDDSGLYVSDDGWCALGFTRLAINDPAHGAQPMRLPAGPATTPPAIVSVTNGEIYNHAELRDSVLKGYALASHSDCEVMAPLVHKYVTHAEDHEFEHVFNLLRGVFATLIVNVETGRFVAARDPIGVRAMFVGSADDGSIWFASEAKALLDHCDRIDPFLPGTYLTGVRGAEHDCLDAETKAPKFVPYYKPAYYNSNWIPTTPVDLQALHDSFTTSCVRRLMSDVPVGVFISGGLDSSIVASIAKRNLPADYIFHSFSCGLEGSPDIAAAQKVANYLGTEHHVLTFTVEQGIQALENVIYHLETYDITTIRASTPMYLLSEMCKKYVKVVLSGEGADEILGGYLYFHNAPNEQEFHEECVRRVKLLYTADVLRGDRSTAAQSLELRVPFLDRDFLDVAMSFSAKDKMCHQGKRIEKWAMREAFSKRFTGEEYLPEEILHRPKEQYSDGVGYNWIDGLKEHCNANVTDAQLASAAATFPHDPPKTKEAYYYRQIFEKVFGKYKGTQGLREGVVKWVPRWSESDDPSGRAQRFHAEAYDEVKKSSART
jgi:asparagine synthase (glutamine-hydrolysing)